MKQILVALMVAFAFSFTASANGEATILRDSVKKEKVVAAKKEAVQTTESDTSSDTTSYTDELDTTAVDMEECNDAANIDLGDDFPFNGKMGNAINGGILIAIVSVLAVFGLPVFVIFIAFFFRYKNRKAQYKLAEQALAAGQPIPEHLLKEVRINDPRSQGIKNTFTGMGLFIFLWAITGEFGIGCIGLLVMFMGIGQWVISINKSKSDRYNEEK